eukprot:CAMPEP_0197693000 /NCGR_PEP_ID=MMETSP1338-20131121/111873_1 /TAXON_ID=43686 ORGANISM="Pelagodinium beii, Strain RCC1491" /NCGR_SAMPLE_ID=MMETSP1338 /ASSEMBLY_ACC=CAM_ASM_000754 /LENGTH=214 /DNA_ID=CAMNT_0043275703 /DNA_START=120 /DNA_END=760 /DNA_ORIENTATION=+
MAGFSCLVFCTYFFGQVSPNLDEACLIFFVLRMGQGMGGSLIMTCLNAALADAFPESRGMVMGASELATSFGWSGGPAIGGLLYSAGGFSLPFTVFSALCLLSALPTMALWASPALQPITPSETSLKRRLSLSHVSGLMPVLFSQVALLTSWCAFDLGYTSWLHDRFGFGTVVSSLYFAIGPTVYMLVSFPVGWLCDRTTRRKLLMAAGMVGQG